VDSRLTKNTKVHVHSSLAYRYPVLRGHTVENVVATAGEAPEEMEEWSAKINAITVAPVSQLRTYTDLLIEAPLESRSECTNR
jgi:hypothetical protein